MAQKPFFGKASKGWKSQGGAQPKSSSSQKKKGYRIRWGRLALTLSVLLLVAYSLLRPLPPKEYPQLADYRGTMTVSQGDFVVEAQLGEHSSRYLLDVLKKGRFRSHKQQPGDPPGDLVLSLGEQVKITLTNGEKHTLALVENGADTGSYKLGRGVYDEVSAIVREAFPGGLQMLEPEPWWSQYLALVPRTLLETDFKSPKEIPMEGVIRYTYLQMVADASAKEFQVEQDGMLVDAIPYDLFLRRARRYFTDGASSSMKQHSAYSPDTNTLNFSGMPADYYGSFPYGDWQDPQTNQSYALRTLTRDSSGTITAVFEDYNKLGFKEQGTLTKLHYLTMVPSTEGDYRFVGKHSELANPENVSAEGYFLSLSSLAQMTPDQAYGNDLGGSEWVGESLLLHTVRYTKEAARLSLFLVDPATGIQLADCTLEGDAKTVFWDLNTTPSGEVLVKTNRNIIRLGGGLQELETIPLPLEKLPSFDPMGYDVTADYTKLVYSDDDGITLYDLRRGRSTNISVHPYELESSSSSSQPPASRWTRPLEPFSRPSAPPTIPKRIITEYHRRPVLVDGEQQVVVARVSGGKVIGYALIPLNKSTPATHLEVSPEADGVVHIDDQKIVITQFPAPPETDRETSAQQPGGAAEPETVPEPTHVQYLVQYFDGSPAREVLLPYEPSAPDYAIAGDSLYHFSCTTEVDPTADSAAGGLGEHLYRLCVTNLKTLEEKELSVLIQNALPSILGVGRQGQVVFSYRAPAGGGFGITRGLTFGGDQP